LSGDLLPQANGNCIAQRTARTAAQRKAKQLC
jgi:hypothetical protein